MKLHNNKSEFRAAISNTARLLGIQEHIIEKDYWLTLLLNRAATFEYQNYIVFKGGTSLSKAYGLINRFSEDVDLAVKPEGISKNGIHHRSGEAIHKIIKGLKLREFVNIQTSKESEKFRYKRAYAFPQIFNFPSESPIHDQIILEVNAFTNPLPVQQRDASCLITQYLCTQLSDTEINELQLNPFSINVLAAERTFCEKLLAIRRAAHKGGNFLSARIRHAYDIHQLFNSSKINDFAKGQDFKSMLNICISDDELNQKISNETQQKVYESSIFRNPKKIMEELNDHYENLRTVTYDNRLPSLESIIDTFFILHSRLMEIDF